MRGDSDTDQINGRGEYDVAFYVPLVGSLLAPGSARPPGGAETQLYLLARELADSIVVQTETQVRMCRERFGREPLLARSMVEPTERRREKPEAFLWIGKLAFYKRPLEFVELARAVPEARFWMVTVPSEKDSAQIAAELVRAARGLQNLA